MGTAETMASGSAEQGVYLQLYLIYILVFYD